MNRSARVRFDGSWVLRDIPTDRGPVRVRATCTEEGETRSGASDFFVLEPDTSVEIPQIQLGANAAIPATLALALPVAELTAAGETAQLTVTASFPDGAVADLAAAASGTGYTVSNPAVLTVGADGLASFAAEPATIVFTRPLGGSGGEVARQLAVSGELIDGFTIDLTSTAFGTGYASSNLFVCSFGVPDGRLFAGQDGTCRVTVDNSGFSAEVAVTVRRFPLPVASLAMPGYANNVDVAGDTAYVAAGAAGLVVVDIANRAAPRIVASLDTSGQANDVEVRGGLAFVADHGAGLLVIDVSDPASPALLGSVDTPGLALDVDADGDPAQDDLVYLADGDGGLLVIDVSAPAAPVIAGGLAVALSSVRDIAGKPGTPLLALAARDAAGVSSVVLVDVSDPASPAQLGSFALPGAQVEAVAFAGDAVLAGSRDGLGLATLDAGDPAAPQLLATMVPSESGLLNDVEVLGDLAFGADRIFVNAVPVIDVGDPADPFAVGFADFSGTGDDNGTGIAADDRFLYLTASQSGGRFRPSGSSRLYIGQTVPIDDTAGLPPAVEILAPAGGASFFEGDTVQVVVDALDDIGVASVSLLVDGEAVASDTTDPFVFSDTEAPYGFDFSIPLGTTSFTLEAVATDDLGASSTAARTITVAPDPPPAVTLTSPVAGASVTAELPALISAEVSDNRGLSAVVLRVDGTPVFSGVTPPFSATVDVPLGAASLTVEVEATDDLGRTTTAVRVVPVVLGEPPVVILLTPSDGAAVVEGTPLAILAQASDDVGVSSVELAVDGATVASFTAPPFQAEVTVPVGVSQLTVTATATDTAGQTTTAGATVTVGPDEPPTVTLLEPEDGQQVAAGGVLRAVAAAADDVGVAAVRFFVDGSLAFDDDEAPYEADLEVPASAGTLAITAVAEDTAGQQTASPAVLVEVVSDSDTTVVGRVLDEAGDPAGGVAVTCAGAGGATLPNGTFLLAGVSAQAPISCEAILVTAGGRVLDTRSAAVEPVLDGVTDVGDIELAEVAMFAGVGRGSEESPGALLTVDQATGEGTLVGQTLVSGEEGRSGLTGIAFDDADRLFGSTISGFGSVSTLVRIDALSGALLETVGEIRDAATGDGLAIGDLTFEPGTGVLFALGSQDFSGELYRVDTTTAEATFVGLAPFGGGLAFAPDGTLYLAGDGALLVLDPADAGLLGGLPLEEFYDGLGARPGDGLLFATVGGDDAVYAGAHQVGQQVAVEVARARSRGDGSFGDIETISYEVEASGVALGDFDGDGDLDVATVSPFGDEGSVLLGNGDGSFQAESRLNLAGGGASRPEKIIAADLNGDGRDDLLTANSGSGNVTIARSLGGGVFQLFPFPIPEGPRGLAAADVTGDGVPDLVTANSYPESVSVARGTGSGLFGFSTVVPVSGSSPEDVALVDVDGDGDLDIVSANLFSGDVSVLHNSGSGSFSAEERFNAGAAPMGLAVGDVNADGLPDLAVLQGQAFGGEVALAPPEHARALSGPRMLEDLEPGVTLLLHR